LKLQDKDAEKNSWVLDEIEKVGAYDVYTEEAYLQLLNATVGVHPLREGARVLDAGCGSASFGLRLAQMGFKVWACDLSYPVLISSKKRSLGGRIPIHLCVGDLERLPFGSEVFDACFCSDVLHHFPECSGAAKELLRVLRPGGYVFSNDPNRLNLHNYLCQDPRSPVRYDKLTPNERALDPREIGQLFRKLGAQVTTEFLFCELKRRGSGALFTRWGYKFFGFIFNSIKGTRRRLLALVLYNAAHLLTVFLPAHRKANVVVCVTRKSKRRK
jgi:ubiquinone/menaquinone biosynthesis C-methylase UbiE